MHDEQNREDALLGAAWRRCEAALPKGWRLGSVRASVAFDGYVTRTVGWTATAHDGVGIPSQGSEEGHAKTITAALDALREALEARTE